MKSEWTILEKYRIHATSCLSESDYSLINCWLRHRDVILQIIFDWNCIFVIFRSFLFCLLESNRFLRMHIPVITSFEVAGSPILLYHLWQRACPLFAAASWQSPRLFLHQFLCWSPSLRLPPKSCWDADRMPERKRIKRQYCEQNEVRLKHIIYNHMIYTSCGR